MQETIFRFVNVRPPQRKKPSADTIDAIDPYRGGQYDTDFKRALREALVAGDRSLARQLSDNYLAKNDRADSLSALQSPFAVFDRALVSLNPSSARDHVAKTIQNVFGADAPVVTRRGDFHTDRHTLADSLTAGTFASVLPMPAPSHLVRGLRLAELVERIAADDPDIKLVGGVPRILRATVLIPFADVLKIDLNTPPAAPQPLYRLRSGMTGGYLYTASAIERAKAMREFQLLDEGICCYVHAQKVLRTVPLFRLWNSRVDDHLYTTNGEERDAAIQNGGYIDEGIAGYVHADPMAQATPLYRLVSGGTKHHLYTTSAAERDDATSVSGFAFEGVACYVLTIPIHAGLVKLSGVADLLTVRQTLRRYDRGEIAHIENAMKGESKERSHRRTDMTETMLLQETERTTEQERDLQSTERFELKSEANKTLREDLQSDAGMTVAATYGPVTTTATGEFAFDRSIEESSRTATDYARDVVERSRTRFQERTLERRTTRRVAEVEETAKHGIDNKAGADHVIGIYRWIDKVYAAQIVNYGKRLMLEFYVPEPATYYRVLRADQGLRALSRDKPTKPIVKTANGTEDLQPKHLVKWPDDVQPLVALYGAAGVAPPPPPVLVVGASVEIPFTDQDYEKIAPVGLQREIHPALGATKVEAELKIPHGYIAISAEWSGDRRAYIRKLPPDFPQPDAWTPLTDAADTSVSVGAFTGGLSGSVGFDRAYPGGSGYTDTLPVAVISSAAGAVITLRVICHRLDEFVAEWQVKTYDAIMTAYRDQLQQYDEEVARVNTERGVQISGRPPGENRGIERTELKRAAISILTTQDFDAFGALKDAVPQDRSRSPKIAFDSVSVEAQIVGYFEQVFEWHNMTYVFYPYFWGRKSHWPEIVGEESTDPLFLQFLRAGYARVQVPVRHNFETMVLYYLTSSKLWQDTEDAPVAQPYLPLIDEIRSQTGEDFLLGTGTVSVKKESNNVTGIGTAFNQYDVDREIRIQSKVYRVASVLSSTEVLLAKPFMGEPSPAEPYLLGPRLVGPSWEVRVPTELVMIDHPDIVLPSWQED